jgi:hypothetical protein
MSIKCTNIFSIASSSNLTKLRFLVWKYSYHLATLIRRQRWRPLLKIFSTFFSLETRVARWFIFKLNIPFLWILEGLRLEKVEICFWPFGIFYRRLGYLWPVGSLCLHLVHFPVFGIMYQEKSGNPARDEFFFESTEFREKAAALKPEDSITAWVWGLESSGRRYFETKPSRERYYDLKNIFAPKLVLFEKITISFFIWS